MEKRTRAELDIKIQREKDDSMIKDYYIRGKGKRNWKYTVTELCEVHNITRPTFYAILKRNGIKR